MNSIFVFEAHDFIVLTKPTITNVEDGQYYLPHQSLSEFYDWVIGYILTKQFKLPITNFNDDRSVVFENIYRSIEPQVARYFVSIISPEELQRMSYAGEMKYVFNGQQLFIFTCSQV